MRPRRVLFAPPAQAQLDRWARDNLDRAHRLRRIVVQKLTIDGDSDAATGPTFGRVRSLLTTPVIGNGEYLRVLWEIVGEEAHVWALSIAVDRDLDEDDEAPPE